MNELVDTGAWHVSDTVAQVVPVPKRIRAVFAGETVADSVRVLLLREPGHPPVYYFPREDVRRNLLVLTSDSRCRDRTGEVTCWTLKAGGRVRANAAWSFERDMPELQDHIAFHWDLMDAWFEEDDEVFVHARDPFKRIDVTASSRRVQIVIAGETVADSTRPLLLFEPGLPIRYYLPKTDLRLDLLTPSDAVTRCPYKGEAGYYSVQTPDVLVEDIAWYYRYPTVEVSRIANMVAFYQERVEAFYIDGELQRRLRRSWAN